MDPHTITIAKRTTADVFMEPTPEGVEFTFMSEKARVWFAARLAKEGIDTSPADLLDRPIPREVFEAAHLLAELMSQGIVVMLAEVKHGWEPLRRVIRELAIEEVKSGKAPAVIVVKDER